MQPSASPSPDTDSDQPSGSGRDRRSETDRAVRSSGTDRANRAADLAAVTRHRAELREAASAVEAALAAPAPGRSGPWLERVRAALMELLADFREHVELTEGVKGVEGAASPGQYAALLRVAPRLTAAVSRLCQEHVELLDTITENLDRLERLPQPLPSERDQAIDISPETIREDCTRLLGRLVRHRQRGSDLFYEAYEVDIGGQD